MNVPGRFSPVLVNVPRMDNFVECSGDFGVDTARFVNVSLIVGSSWVVVV